jgi:hypothetical protein
MSAAMSGVDQEDLLILIANDGIGQITQLHCFCTQGEKVLAGVFRLIENRYRTDTCVEFLNALASKFTNGSKPAKNIRYPPSLAISDGHE